MRPTELCRRASIVVDQPARTRRLRGAITSKPHDQSSFQRRRVVIGEFHVGDCAGGLVGLLGDASRRAAARSPCTLGVAMPPNQSSPPASNGASTATLTTPSTRSRQQRTTGQRMRTTAGMSHHGEGLDAGRVCDGRDVAGSRRHVSVADRSRPAIDRPVVGHPAETELARGVDAARAAHRR